MILPLFWDIIKNIAYKHFKSAYLISADKRAYQSINKHLKALIQHFNDTY